MEDEEAKKIKPINITLNITQVQHPLQVMKIQGMEVV
jgi:hypothetical protein